MQYMKIGADIPYSAYGEIAYLQDLDDESGTLLRSASRSMKRSRTAEAHNLSERVSRPHIPVRSITLCSIHPFCQYHASIVLIVL